jgi:hypothetical protein
MYKEKVLTLPGGFPLPFALIAETTYRYDCDTQEAEAEAPAWLAQDAQIYLRNQMIAGKILDADVTVQLQDDVYRLNGFYSCLEEIGQIRVEEKIYSNG